jgi:hypothetical protein
MRGFRRRSTRGKEAAYTKLARKGRDDVMAVPDVGTARKGRDRAWPRLHQAMARPGGLQRWRRRPRHRSATRRRVADPRPAVGLGGLAAGDVKFSTDPGLEAKVRDVVGLYLDPQERAIVVCVDEKSQIQDVPDDEHESPKQLKRWTSRVQDRAREHRSAQLHAPFAAVTAAWLIESDLDADARRPGEDAATRRTSQERRRPGRVAAVEGQLAGLVVAADQQPGLPAWPSGARPWWSWSRRRNG